LLCNLHISVISGAGTEPIQNNGSKKNGFAIT
jgi:hypothetical protein